MLNIRRPLVKQYGLVLVLILAASSPVWAQSDAREEQAFKDGVDAYIYAYPLVTMEMTRRVVTDVAKPEDTHAPMGQFASLRTYPNASFRDVTAPNADTLYSSAFLDLSAEPYVLQIPDEHGRYFLMPMLSAWTDVFAVPGKRTTGTDAQTYAITGPNWKGSLPDGVKELKSPTDMVWIIGRTYSSGTPDDYAAVHAIQDRYKLTPLSAYGKPYTPPPGKVDASVDTKTPVREQVNRVDVGTYFKTMAALMKDNPPAPADAPMVEKLAKIGIVPGQDFDIGKLDAAAAKGLERAHKAALEQIIAHEKTAGKTVNGWVYSLQTGAYGTDYLQRATIAFFGLGANLPQDAVYPVAETDGSGKRLTGANQYVLHFAAGETPPVDGFWSLTMYDKDFFFVANPINRYAISPRDALKKNADGSTDLYIQAESPGPDKESNWLPAPKDEFVLMTRLYWPREAVLDGSWKIPPVEQVVLSGTSTR